MDNLSPEQRRKNMQNIRSKGTKPEVAVFQELKKRKIYFAPHADTITGHPDRYPPPKSNTEYWEAKLFRTDFRIS